MKLKLLPAIVSFLFLAIAISSCLDSDDKVEYGSDDTIRAFELDTIYGVKYKFTIDQVNRRIYNADSIPMSADTIIDKILIKTITTSAYYITTGDTLYNYASDSIDLTETMTKPFRIKLHAPDGLNSREYSIEVRRHLQDPDSLTWHKKSDSFSNEEATGVQKTVILKGKLLTFISNSKVYSSNVSDGKAWTGANVSGLPSNSKLTSIINFKNTLYIAAEDGKVFSSTDGTEWNQSPISGNVVTLLTVFPDYISGIIKENGVSKFAVTNTEVSQWETGEVVPEEFPLENISSTSFKTDTGLYKYILTGNAANKTKGATVPWFTFDGKEWVDLATNTSYVLPEMKYPTIVHYNDSLYAFGEKFDAFYTSVAGIVWRKKEEKVLFPEEFKNRNAYSTVTDDDHFIWIIGSKDSSHKDDVWMGRINKLGFLMK